METLNTSIVSLLQMHYFYTMDEKKKHIITQVGQMYMRHGIRSVTMDDVASELSISKKTLYQYFKDKAELVEHVINHFLMDDSCFCTKEDLKLNAIDRYLWIRKNVLEMMKVVHNNLEYDLKKGYPSLYKKITDYKRIKIYDDNFAIIEQGKKEGLYRESIDSDLVARLAVGRILLIFNPDYGIFADNEIRNIELFDNMMNYHMHGICTETGLQYYKQQLNNVQNEN